MYNENNGIHGYRIMHFYLTKLRYQIIFLTTYRYMKELKIKSIVRKRKADKCVASIPLLLEELLKKP